MGASTSPTHRDRAFPGQETASPLPPTPPAQQLLLYPLLFLKSSKKDRCSLARGFPCGLFAPTSAFPSKQKAKNVLAGCCKQGAESREFLLADAFPKLHTKAKSCAAKHVGDAHVPDLLLLRLPAEVVLEEEPFARDVSRVLPILIVIQVLGNFLPDFILNRFGALLSKPDSSHHCSSPSARTSTLGPENAC